MDPTVKKGAARKCLDTTCHLTFAGYVIAGVLSIVVAGSCAFALFWWKFDLPNNGNSICYALMGMTLTLWAKPLNRRRTRKKKKKKKTSQDLEEGEEVEESEAGSDHEGPREVFLDGMVDYNES